MGKICKDREIDYFILESMPDDGSGMTVAEILAAGNECYFIFVKDGGFTMNMFSKIAAGKWKDSVVTFPNGDEAADIKFKLDGDLLKIDFGDGEMAFKRSDKTPPEPLKPAGGKTAGSAVSLYGGQKGTMTAVCPDGWYDHTKDYIDSQITFKESRDSTDDELPSITIHCYANLLDKPESSLKKGGFTVNGRVWNRANEDINAVFTLSAVIDKAIVDIFSTVIKPESDIFQQVLKSFALIWD